MRLFTSLEFNSLEDLFLEQIGDLYDAEQRLTQALPKMADAAHSPALKSAFQTHLRETKGHVSRLERIFKQFGKTPERETCAAMKGLISEGEDMINATGDPHVKDAALIAAANASSITKWRATAQSAPLQKNSVAAMSPANSRRRW